MKMKTKTNSKETEIHTTKWNPYSMFFIYTPLSKCISPQKDNTNQQTVH